MRLIKEQLMNKPDDLGKASKDYRCPNCSSIANTNFCPNCGQKKITGKDTFADLFKNFWGHYFHYDSKFWKTIWTLLSIPGALTIAYRKGRRQRYLMPVTLYVYVSVTFFLISSLLPDPSFRIEARNASKSTRGTFYIAGDEGRDSIGTVPETIVDWQSYWDRKLSKAIESPDQLQERIGMSLPKVFFIMIPVLALLLKIIFWRNGAYYYTDHTVFALHVQSFAFLAGIGGRLLLLFAAWVPAVSYLSVLLPLVPICFYFVLSLRKVYGVNWFKAMAITFFVLSGYLLILFLTTVAAALIVISFW